MDDGLLAALRAMTKEERRRIGEVIQEVRTGFGRPHLHAGTGIRDLSPRGSKENIYECRVGRSLRLIFTVERSTILYFHMLGTHDEVRRFLKAAG